jgi:predicted ATP-grasp superfamily ATP-dependent carboligase
MGMLGVTALPSTTQMTGRDRGRLSSLRGPPAIILGGGANALSVARLLGERGVKVYAINSAKEHVCYSRFAESISVSSESSIERAWTRYLLGDESKYLHGSVLLACSDRALQLIATHHEELGRKFLLDAINPTAQLCMLNKLCTYRAATAAGVSTPKYWTPQNEQQLLEVRDELVYPLVVKPELSHESQKRLGEKLFIARDFSELVQLFRKVLEGGIDVMLVEMIPGGDDLLCSYYTYLDENGIPLCHFTKRIVRRYPAVHGIGCCHVTDWIPELIPISLRLFEHVGLQGLANVEFKRDPRDGQLKLIECNARFTAANCLVADSGFDLAMLVYSRLTGAPQDPLTHYSIGKRLWYPLEDFLAWRDMPNATRPAFLRWLASHRHPASLPFFRWSDPVPTIVAGGWRLRDIIERRAHKVRRWLSRIRSRSEH